MEPCVVKSSEKSFDIAGDLLNPFSKNYDIQHMPFSVYYIDYGRRFCSFYNWPKQIRQSPKELASVGFYYTGKSDKVECFSCGLNLQAWEVNDNPAYEHSVKAPKCKFIQSICLDI